MFAKKFEQYEEILTGEQAFPVAQAREIKPIRDNAIIAVPFFAVDVYDGLICEKLARVENLTLGASTSLFPQLNALHDQSSCNEQRKVRPGDFDSFVSGDLTRSNASFVDLSRAHSHRRRLVHAQVFV